MTDTNEAQPNRAKIEVSEYRSRPYTAKSISVTVKMPDERSVIVELEQDGSLSVCAYDQNGDDISDLVGFNHNNYDGWART